MKVASGESLAAGAMAAAVGRAAGARVAILSARTALGDSDVGRGFLDGGKRRGGRGERAHLRLDPIRQPAFDSRHLVLCFVDVSARHRCFTTPLCGVHDSQMTDFFMWKSRGKLMDKTGLTGLSR